MIVTQITRILYHLVSFTHTARTSLSRIDLFECRTRLCDVKLDHQNSNTGTRASIASRSCSYEDYSPTNKSTRRSRHGVVKLIPIDHGFTLPRIDALSDASFEWLRWPQARKPFTEDMLSYIKDLDADADVRILRRYRTPRSSSCLRIENRSLLTLRVCTSWLKQCASTGMTPYEIGRTMCRSSTSPAEPSVLEFLVSESSRIANIDLSLRDVNNQEILAFMSAFSKVSKDRISKKTIVM